MFKIRKHLAKGRFYNQWQIKGNDRCTLQSPSDSWNDTIAYFSPTGYQIECFDCSISLALSTAQKIYSGANKSVCSYLIARRYDWYRRGFFLNTDGMNQIRFNPRVSPNWQQLESDGVWVDLDCARTKFARVILTNSGIFARFK